MKVHAPQSSVTYVANSMTAQPCQSLDDNMGESTPSVTNTESSSILHVGGLNLKLYVSP